MLAAPDKFSYLNHIHLSLPLAHLLHAECQRTWPTTWYHMFYISIFWSQYRRSVFTEGMQTLKVMIWNSSRKSCPCNRCRSHAGWVMLLACRIQVAESVLPEIEQFPHLQQVCVNTLPLSHEVAVKPWGLWIASYIQIKLSPSHIHWKQRKQEETPRLAGKLWLTVSVAPQAFRERRTPIAIRYTSNLVQKSRQVIRPQGPTRAYLAARGLYAQSTFFRGSTSPGWVSLLLITFKAGGCIFRELVSVEVRPVRERNKEKATLGRKSDIARNKGVQKWRKKRNKVR